MQESIKMQPNETIKDYKIRLFRNKSIYNLKPQAIADLINNVAGTNYNESTFRKWWAIYREALEDCKNADVSSIQKNGGNGNKYKGSVEYKNGNIISDKLIEICDDEQMTPEILMKKHGLDSTQWSVVSYRNNYWHSQVKGGKQIVMYQSKITVKPSVEELSMKTLKEHFDKFDRNYTQIRFIDYLPNSRNAKNALILPISDLHFGRYSSAIISGEQYDMDIAEKNYFEVINDIANYCKSKDIEKIYYPIGNDLFNSDNISGSTQKLTPQDNNGLWQEIVLKCQEMIIRGIELLSNISEIEIFYIKSNHDTQTSFQLYQYIAAWFRKDNRIIISQNYTDYNFIKYGQGIYGFAHDVKKKDSVHKLFDTYAREWLSSTIFREFFLAHTHTEQVVYDNGGTVIRRLPTISVPCKWSHENAYIGNIKRCQSFLINDELGITDIHYTIINQ